MFAGPKREEKKQHEKKEMTQRAREIEDEWIMDIKSGKTPPFLCQWLHFVFVVFVLINRF